MRPVGIPKHQPPQAGVKAVTDWLFVVAMAACILAPLLGLVAVRIEPRDRSGDDEV